MHPESVSSRHVLDTFREFNRFYTVLIGSLARGYLETPYTLQEARVIFEVATKPGCTAKEIRYRAGFDQAYLSRLITRLVRANIIRRAASAADGREQKLFLTKSGRSDFKVLDERANLQATQLLERLTPDERDILGVSLQTVQGLLDNTSRNERPTIRRQKPGDLGWILQRHAIVYARDFRYSNVFEAYVCEGLARFAENYEPNKDRLWIGEIGGKRVGSVAVQHVDSQPGWAQLRWFLVEKETRGKGLGTTLLNNAVAFSNRVEYKGIFLWTVSDLDAARRLYERIGFKLVEKKKGCAWAPWAHEQRWELRL